MNATDLARQAFYRQYSAYLATPTWSSVKEAFGHSLRYPKSAEEWQALGREMRDRIREGSVQR